MVPVIRSCPSCSGMHATSTRFNIECGTDDSTRKMSAASSSCMRGDCPKSRYTSHRFSSFARAKASREKSVTIGCIFPSSLRPHPLSGVHSAFPTALLVLPFASTGTGFITPDFDRMKRLTWIERVLQIGNVLRFVWFHPDDIMPTMLRTLLCHVASPFPRSRPER